MLFLAFSPLAVVGVYYVLKGQIQAGPILASIPLGIFTMNVGLVSNTFDYHDNVASGKKCIPVLVGQRNAVGVIRAGNILAYLAVITGVILRLLPVWTLLMLLTLPLAFLVVKEAKRFEDTENYTSAMTKAITLSTVAGSILWLAYLLPGNIT